MEATQHLVRLQRQLVEVLVAQEPTHLELKVLMVVVAVALLLGKETVGVVLVVVASAAQFLIQEIQAHMEVAVALKVVQVEWLLAVLKQQVAELG
jgi:hypothetical protein